VARYSLEIKQSAQKELDALDDALFNRIDRKILVLAENPRPAGCKKLKGYKDQWRVRVGDIRDKLKHVATKCVKAHSKC
jgi:mRNA interferase RelE/StbE